ncbi:tape measure protein [Armatimonas sp.]|uniref:tape measure protein n=1 Tax=Armatimonas sp. TaxID=1872638 RepID=UPI00286C69EF|nr:tape measure protein [Armatimonas sp.]
MRRAQQETRKTASTAEQAGQRIQKVGESLSRIGGSLTLGVTAPLLALGRQSVKTAVELDSLKRGLIAITGSSAEAERQLVRLRKIAELPGLGFKEAIQGSLRLQSAGLSAKRAEASLREFGNAIAAAGGGKEQLDGVTLALSQIASKGKVSAEEINQIAERFYGVRTAMQAAFGTSDTEILQKAKLTATEFIDGVVGVLSKDKRVGDSLANQFENANQKISDSLARIGSTLAPKAADALGAVADKVDLLGKAWDKLPKEKQDLLANLGLTALAAGPMTMLIGNILNLASGLKELGVSAQVLSQVGKGGLIGLGIGAVMVGGTLAYKYMTEKNGRQTEEKAGRPYYLDAEEEIRGNRQKISDIEAAAADRRKNSGGGDSAYLAGIGGLLSPSDQQEVNRLRQENAKLESMASLLRGKAEKSAKEKEAADAKAKRAGIDAVARAKRLEAEAKARKEREAEAERLRKEKEANDKRYREEAAQRLKDAQDRLAARTLPPVALKQREARRQHQEDKYYGVPDADQILRRTLEKNTFEEVGSQLRGFSFPGLLSGGFDGLDALRKEQSERQKTAFERMGKGGIGETKSLVDSLSGTLKSLRALGEENKKTQLKKLKFGLEGAADSYESQTDSLTSTMRYLQSYSKDKVRAYLRVKPERPRDRLQQYAHNKEHAYANANALTGDLARGGGGFVMNMMRGQSGKGAAKDFAQTLIESLNQGAGKEIERVIARSLTDPIAKALERGFQPSIDKLAKSIEASTKGLSFTAQQILSGAYSLMAMSQRKKKFGWGTGLGLAAGLLTGGSVPTVLALMNMGNAADNNDFGGAVAGGLNLFTQGNWGNSGGGGGATSVPSSPNAPADGRSVKGGQLAGIARDEMKIIAGSSRSSGGSSSPVDPQALRAMVMSEVAVALKDGRSIVINNQQNITNAGWNVSSQADEKRIVENMARRVRVATLTQG